METGNSPELNALLQDGMDNLEVLSDKRLREYAGWSLKEQGATSHSSLSELLAMAEVNAVHTREQQKESLLIEQRQVGPYTGTSWQREIQHGQGAVAQRLRFST